MSPPPTTLEDLLTNGQVPELPTKNTKTKKRRMSVPAYGRTKPHALFFKKRKEAFPTSGDKRTGAFFHSFFSP